MDEQVRRRRPGQQQGLGCARWVPPLPILKWGCHVSSLQLCLPSTCRALGPGSAACCLLCCGGGGAGTAQVKRPTWAGPRAWCRSPPPSSGAVLAESSRILVRRGCENLANQERGGKEAGPCGCLVPNQNSVSCMGPRGLQLLDRGGRGF